MLLNLFPAFRCSYFSENGFDDSDWGYYHDPFGVISFGPLFVENQYSIAKDYETYKSNTHAFIEAIENYLECI